MNRTRSYEEVPDMGSRNMHRTRSSNHDVADGGWGWVVMIGACFNRVLYGGMLMTTGVYMVELQKSFQVGASAVSVIATVVACGAYAGALLSGALLKRFGCRRTSMGGGLIAVLFTFAASCAGSMWQLYLCFGVTGVLHGVAVVPDAIILGYYFKRRLGIATGVMFAGLGAGVLILTPLLEGMCSYYGWRGALMIHSAINANIIAFGALFRPTILEKQVLKAHRNISLASGKEKAANRRDHFAPCATLCITLDNFFAFSRLLKYKLFIVYTAVSIFTCWGYISTSLFLYPRMVEDLGMSTKTASLVMIAFGLSSTLTRFFHGFIIDYNLVTVTNLNLIATILCGICSVLMPVVPSIPVQVVLSVILGGAGGLMDTMIPTVIRQYVPMDYVSNGIGLLCGMTVFGMLIGTQLTGKLRDVTGSYDIPFYISGALLVGSGTVLALFVKCSRWKDYQLISRTTKEPQGSLDRDYEHYMHSGAEEDSSLDGMYGV